MVFTRSLKKKNAPFYSGQARSLTLLYISLNKKPPESCEENGRSLIVYMLSNVCLQEPRAKIHKHAWNLCECISALASEWATRQLALNVRNRQYDQLQFQYIKA